MLQILKIVLRAGYQAIHTRLKRMWAYFFNAPVLISQSPALPPEQAATKIQKIWRGFKERKLLSIADLTWMYAKGIALRNQSYTAGMKERAEGGHGDAYSLAFLQLSPECVLKQPWLPGMESGVTFKAFAENNHAEQALLEAYYTVYREREAMPHAEGAQVPILTKAEYQAQVLFGKRNMLFVNAWWMPQIPPQAAHAALRHRMHVVLSHLIARSLYVFRKEEHNMFHIMGFGQGAQGAYDRDAHQYPTGKCGKQRFYSSQVLASVCQNASAHRIGLEEDQTPAAVKRRHREVKDLYYKVIAAIKKVRLGKKDIVAGHSVAAVPVVASIQPTQGWFAGYWQQASQLVQRKPQVHTRQENRGKKDIVVQAGHSVAAVPVVASIQPTQGWFAGYWQQASQLVQRKPQVHTRQENRERVLLAH